MRTNLERRSASEFFQHRQKLQALRGLIESSNYKTFTSCTLWYTLLAINPYIAKYCMYLVGLVHGTHPIHQKDPLQPPVHTSDLNSNLRAASSSSFKAVKQQCVIFVSCSKSTKEKKESQKSCSQAGKTQTQLSFGYHLQTLQTRFSPILMPLYTAEGVQKDFRRGTNYIYLLLPASLYVASFRLGKSLGHNWTDLGIGFSCFLKHVQAMLQKLLKSPA